MNDRSILVTGAGGFVGGVIASHLRKRGARVVGTGRSHAGPTGDSFVYLDLEDPMALKALNAQGPYDAVIHCAVVLPGKRSDVDLLVANQKMTYHVAEWAVDNTVRDFLLASSCSVYGYSDQPCAESAVPAPPHLYAVSKLAGEHIVRMVAGGAGLRTCILRISAPYGPGLRAETVVKRFLTQAAQNQPITLLGSGRRSQDFVYEVDVASGFSLALECGATGTFNLSGGRPVSMRELAETVLHVFGRNGASAVRYAGPDPQESYRGRFPIEAAMKAFGYRPHVGLEDGLRRTAQAWGWL